jgi:FkbM family methyltransferase
MLPPRPAGPRANQNGLGAGDAVQSQTVDLSDLAAIPDDERFLREAYRRILGRDCDISGLVSYSELLRRHVPRRVVLLQIINSEEGKQRGIRFTGIQDAGPAGRVRSRFFSAPNVLGRVNAAIADVIQRILLARINLIDHKLDCVLREVTTRTDDLAAKTDQSLWTLSEKLDAYVAHLSEDSRRGREELALQRIHLQELHRSAELARDLVASGESRIGGLLLDLVAQTRQWDQVLTSGREELQALSATLREAIVAADTASQGAAAIIETVRANTFALMEEQRRAHALLSDQVAYSAQISDRQRLFLENLNSLQLLAADKSNALHASAAEILARIRPPVISAGADVLVTEVEGMIVGVPGKEWRVAAYHAFRGAMEPGLTKYFRSVVTPGAVVVDVGANVGFYTLLAAKLLQGQGKIYSFEPAPRTYAILKDNVQVNGFLELGIIHLYPLAVTDKAGKARLAVFNADCGHNTLFDDGHADAEIEVSTTSLDDILATQDKVDIVKIDAEGAEPFILRGMTHVIERNPQIRIALEFAPAHLRRAGISSCAFLDTIASFGFAIRRIDDESGELLDVIREELNDALSVNLQLERPL